jgi:hypothetical protein
MTSSDEITCYTDGSFCDNRSGAWSFTDTLKLEESYSLGTYTTVFQAEVYAILACSDICQKARLQNETINILSDSKVALCSNGSALVQNLFINTNSQYSCSAGTLFRRFLPQIGFQVTATLLVMRWLISWQEGASAAIFWGPEPALPLSGSIFQLMTKQWAEYAHL